MSDSDNKDITITFNDASEGGKIDTECLDGDGRTIDSGSVDPQNGNSDSFVCTVPGHDYAGSSTDISVKMCDQAGNCETSSSHTYNFDASPPDVFDLSSVSGVSTFNDNFDASLAASDDASGIDNVEYYFDPDTAEGDGTDLGYSDAKDSYQIDLSGLSQGSHTLYVRAKDNVGRWGTPATFDFQYYPDATPKVDLTAPSGLTVTHGESEMFDVKVDNTGKLYIDQLAVSASSGDFFSDSLNVSGLKANESENVTFEMNADQASLGYHDVSVSTDSPSASDSFKVLVRAEKDQKESINDTYTEYLHKLKELKQNATDLKNSGLSSGRQERLDSSVSSFENKVDSANEAISKGNYYKAKAILNDIGTDFSSAQKSYETVKKEQAAADRKRNIMIAGGVIFLLLVGVGVFIYQSEEYDFNIEALSDSDISIDGLEDIPRRVKMFFKSKEEEAEEFEWNGFND
ncbi:MAG: CARDB domain-containing protein [Candidatus Nanohaloarchaea archaeon]